jgi:hypothetical protein
VRFRDCSLWHAAQPASGFQAALLGCRFTGSAGCSHRPSAVGQSRAVEVLVECHIIGEEGAVAEVEASVLQATRIILALRVVRGGITGEATGGDLGPGAVHVAHPLVTVLHTATV